MNLRDLFMSCPVEFENKKTVSLWSLIGTGGFIWFLSAIVVVNILRPYLPVKEWEDVYILGTKLLQAVCLVGLIVAIDINISVVIHNWLKQWREHLRIIAKYFGIYAGGLAGVLTVGVIILVLLEKTGKIDPGVAATIDEAADANDKILYLKRMFQSSVPRFAFSLGTICVLAPIIEEIFFRRFLFVALRKKMAFVWALGISAALFAIVHPNMALGAIGGIYLGYVYEKGKSLPANILIHGMANFTITVVSMLVRR